VDFNATVTLGEMLVLFVLYMILWKIANMAYSYYMGRELSRKLREYQSQGKLQFTVRAVKVDRSKKNKPESKKKEEE